MNEILEHVMRQAQNRSGMCQPEPARPHHDAQVDALRAAYDRYTQGARGRFAVGELVTSRSDGMVFRSGEPFIVVEIVDTPPGILDTADAAGMVGYGQPNWGARPDMRVLSVDHEGSVLAYWVESWGFDHYKGE